MIRRSTHRTFPAEPRPARRHRVHVVLTLAATIALTRLGDPTALAQNPKPTEFDVKAAYLLNFGKFVRPSNRHAPRSSFDICLVGHDSMGRAIDDLATNERIQNVPVHVRRLPDATAARDCAIAYISAYEGDRIREDLAILAATDVLTVSDAPNFLDRGGMIQFALIASHVRFAVNLNAVARAHLVLSSELLRVASSVTGTPPAGELP